MEKLYNIEILERQYYYLEDYGSKPNETYLSTKLHRVTPQKTEVFGININLKNMCGTVWN
jgi:hypothetical protein